MLPQVRFNKATCYEGIEALRAYKRHFNQKLQQYSTTPLHDWSSNGSDAFRYFALVTEVIKKQKTVEIEAPALTTPDYTLDELFKDRDEEQNWRNQIIRL